MAITKGILKRALEEANKSIYKYKIGCVIFKNKRIISSGHNEVRSNLIPRKYSIWPNSYHAEQAAIFKCKDWSKLKGASILVIKCSKKEQLLSNAWPCIMCQKLIDYVGINKIYYSNEKGEIKLF